MTQPAYAPLAPTAASLYEELMAGGQDFALKNIETYCKATFNKGQNAPSISNDKALRAYVDARRAEADLARRGSPPSPLDQDIEAIPDLDLRNRIRLLAKDYRLVQKRFRILTETLAKLNLPLDLDSLLSGDRSDHEAAVLAVLNARVANDQISALRRVVSFFRDIERVHRAGLDVDAGGIIGPGLRETIAKRRDIARFETLLSTLER